MQQINNILIERYKEYYKNPEATEKLMIARGKEYSKKWNKCVGFFMDRINKDMIKDGKKPLPFMAYRSKLVALIEVEDLRWYWFYCQKVSSIKDLKGNPKYTFGQIFWKGLEVKK